jgi:phosphoglycolate phosphatase
MLQEIMAELNIPPLHTLMIGDSEYDLYMAHHAGVGAIAVSYGVHEKEHLLTCCQPLICLDSLTDLLTWLEK